MNTSCQPRIRPNGAWIGGMSRKALSRKKLTSSDSAGPAMVPIFMIAMARGSFSRGNRSDSIE